MSRPAALEAVLQGRDVLTNAVIAYLVDRGWSVDRIIKNVAMKQYAPNRATFRVTLDLVYRHYLVAGEYVSEGHNVLSTCFASIKEGTCSEQINAQMNALLCEAEQRINNSFAVRFLGNQPSKSA